MKKFILGFIVSAFLFASIPALADTVSMIGKKVTKEAELYLDGKRLSDVIIVDGKSYAPLREIAENSSRSVIYQQPKDGGNPIIILSVVEFRKEKQKEELAEKIEMNKKTLSDWNQGRELAKQRLEKYQNSKVAQFHIDNEIKNIKEYDVEIEKLEETIRIQELELKALESAD